MPVSLDPLAFPHILDLILYQLPTCGLLAARLSSKTLKDLADAHLVKRARHVRMGSYYNKRAVAYACDFFPGNTTVDRSAPLPLQSLKFTKILDDYAGSGEYFRVDHIYDSLQTLQTLRLMNCCEHTVPLLEKLRSATVILFLDAHNSAQWYDGVGPLTTLPLADCVVLRIRMVGTESPTRRLPFHVKDLLSVTRAQRVQLWTDKRLPSLGVCLCIHKGLVGDKVETTVIAPYNARTIAKTELAIRKRCRDGAGNYALTSVEDYRQQIGEEAYQLYLAHESST